MSDIRILRIDENKSKPSDSQPHYVAILSGKPDQTWKTNLDSLIQRSRTAEIMNVRVGQEAPNELSFDTRAGTNLEQAVTTLDNLFKQVNDKEDEFRAQIRDVNKKLSTENSG